MFNVIKGMKMENENNIFQAVEATSQSESSSTNQAIGATKGMSEAQSIAYIRKLNTNFVFFFGKKDTGKTALLASLLRYLSLGDSSLGEFSVNAKVNDGEGAKLASMWSKSVKERRYPHRSAKGGVIHINGVFKPTKRGKPDVDMTFLEMAGEDVHSIEMTEKDVGFLPSHVDVYLRMSGVKILFILAAPFDDAEQYDEIYADFIRYVRGQDTAASSAHIILLVTKWDQNSNRNLDVMDFVKSNLPETYKLIRNPKHIVGAYSLGRTIVADREAYIEEFNDAYPEELTRKIYRIFTGKELKGFFAGLFS
jgi:hypothetical protein